jgi:CRP-like cAMP-binding protein
MNYQPFEQNLKKIVSNYFGELSNSEFEELRKFLTWKLLKAGQCLFKQGDEANAMYIVISGKLAIKIKTQGEEKEKNIGKATKGESIGEMALITGKSRSASAYATRDSILLEFSQTIFQEYIKTNPNVLLAFTKIIIKRLETQSYQPRPESQLNIAFVPLTASVSISISALMQEINIYLNSKYTSFALKETDIQEKFKFDYHADITLEEQSFFSDYIHSLEEEHRFVFYETDCNLSDWTITSILHADTVVLLANFDENTQCNKELLTYIQHLHEQIEDIPIYLTLLHADGSKYPIGTKTKWLDQISPQQHFHIRPNEAKDIRRLARSITGNALGLACGGGGAKGFAHLGVFDALQAIPSPKAKYIKRNYM